MTCSRMYGQVCDEHVDIRHTIHCQLLLLVVATSWSTSQLYQQLLSRLEVS